jgi:hypothetical protein
LAGSERFSAFRAGGGTPEGVTTNLPALSLVFAIPDHPWVDSADGAAVRIAMTVAGPGRDLPGVLATVTREDTGAGEGYDVTLAEARGVIHADLTTGADVTAAKPLRANGELSCPGMKLHGAGFIVTPEEAAQLGLGRIPGLEQHIRPYRHGRDLTATPREAMVIDLFGLSADEVRERFPEVYQWVAERVKPEREARRGTTKDADQYADLWWVFGKPRNTFRPALVGLRRYIATVETSKHRFFVFLDASILPDNMLVNIASDDAWVLGVLSSRVHVTWALAAGGTLEDRPRYNKTVCFEPFPFPAATEEQRARIRDLGERLDAHRKARQALHSELTLTGMYNVLGKLRAGEPLTAKEKTIHEQGLVTVLRELHDELDRVVLDAYGWPHDLDEQGILQRLVDLNAARAAEEASGLVRWLRPEYQNPGGASAQAGDLGLVVPAESATPGTAPAKRPWPKAMAERIQALREVLSAESAPLTPADLAARFSRANAADLGELLDTLVLLGHARRLDDGRCEGVR